ncbi:cytosine permease [Celerinatantimonas diazotrophica]|uniref:Putative hydroxymethylpyrimidine transporter CytX n=1 Tax=Celerinatantimonas diazotrophica TaxID=412034 RepID=A0A4R1J9Z4_9GAMM|nr:cytosine permease [Celerinatantimonas diazotrophica]TCK47453.1 putative hydroxymethylpyrimidine transporter CytX [Celerinatantimonas diazotrophica]CAG9294928.1 hypothetical protein CEDIAZO_00034 [Celerinatantimonas diazotrophica]
MQATEKYTGVKPVSSERQSWAFGDFFALWTSLGIGLAVLQTGALLGPGLGLAQSIMMIVVGTVIGSALIATVGWFSQRHGLSSMALMQQTLGLKGAYIPACMNFIQLIGWGAFEIVLMRNAAIQLIEQWWPGSTWLTIPLVWTLLLGVLATWQAIKGPLSWVRVFLRRVGIWIVITGCAGLTYYWFSHYSLAHFWQQAGDHSMPKALGLDIVISMAVSWLPLVGDYSRFGKSSGHTFHGTALGYLVGTVWIMALGVAYQVVLPAGSSSTQLMLSLGVAFSGLPLLMVLFDETENAFAPIHSSAVSASIVVRWPISYLAMLFGVISTIVAWCVPTAAYLDFLLWIGSVFTPLFALLMVDYFSSKQLRSPGKLQVCAALVAWFLGVVTYHVMTSYYPDWGATLPTLVVSAVVYGLLRWLVSCLGYGIKQHS